MNKCAQFYTELGKAVIKVNSSNMKYVKIFNQSACFGNQIAKNSESNQYQTTLSERNCWWDSNGDL